MHAVEFLKSNAVPELKPVIVLVGNQRQFKQAVIVKLQKTLFGENADSLQLSHYQGSLKEEEEEEDKRSSNNNENEQSESESEERDPDSTSPKCQIDLATVRDELTTVSMWGGPRVVVVEKAGSFIKEYRAGLEKYCQQPPRNAFLILDVKSWPKTTKLAKQTAKTGLVIDCSTPTGNYPSDKKRRAKILTDWITYYAQSEHGKKLHRNVAQLLMELAGDDVGLLEQEVMKLASYVGEQTDIKAEHVTAVVGDWKEEVTWTMTDAIRDGQLAVALPCLQKLLNAGEAPQKIMGGINYVFRKYALAAEIARQGRSLPEALRKAEVYSRDIESVERYMRRVGRPNIEKLYTRLQTVEQNLKGGSRLNLRLQLERLVVELACPE